MAKAPSLGQQRALVLAVVGIGMLLSTPFLMAYSYTATTRSADSKTITIEYVYPLQPLTLVFLLCGPALSAYGFWRSRRLLGMHRSIPAALAWLGMAVASLLWNPLLLTLNSIYPIYHVLWAKGTEFPITPEYIVVLLVSSSFLSGLSLCGIWISRRLLPAHTRKISIAFGVGALISLLSLLKLEHIAVTSYEVYQRGYPLPWLVLSNGLVGVMGWIPTSFLIFDLIFWSGIVLAFGLVGTKLRRDH